MSSSSSKTAPIDGASAVASGGSSPSAKPIDRDRGDEEAKAQTSGPESGAGGGGPGQENTKPIIALAGSSGTTTKGTKPKRVRWPDTSSLDSDTIHGVPVPVAVEVPFVPDTSSSYEYLRPSQRRVTKTSWTYRDPAILQAREYARTHRSRKDKHQHRGDSKDNRERDGTGSGNDGQTGTGNAGDGNGIPMSMERKPFGTGTYNSANAASTTGHRSKSSKPSEKPKFSPPKFQHFPDASSSSSRHRSGSSSASSAPICIGPRTSTPLASIAGSAAAAASLANDEAERELQLVPMVLPLRGPGESENKFVFGMCGELVNDAHAIGLFVNPLGWWTIRFQDGIHVDITMDGGIRVINWPANIIIAMDGPGSCSALVHPTGRMYQYGSRVECSGMDDKGIVKYAKCSYKGITFSSDRNSLIYIVDSAGTRSTNDVFSDMTGDFATCLFLKDTIHGPEYVSELVEALPTAHYWIDEHGAENWIINGFRVSMSLDCCVRVSKVNSHKIMLRTSASTGTTLISTPFIHCTGSMGEASRHLYIKRGERRVHFDGSVFIIRNGGHAAGIDEFNKVQIY